MKALFTDIDGTLITSDLKITPKTREALQRWTDSGNILVLCSSRSAPAIEPLIREFHLSCCISAIGGALLLDEQRRVLSEKGYDAALAGRVLDFIEERGYDLTWGLYTKDLWFVKDRSDPRIVREEEIVKITAQSGSVSDIPKGTPVEKILCMCGSPEQALEAEKELTATFPELSFTRSSPVFIEINSRGVSKADAIREICEHYDISIKDTIAFGDQYNDLQMILAAGTGVAMGNAPEDIKAAANIVTSDNNHDGIAKILAERF